MIRVLTYNVHRCVGMDGRVSPERIAELVGDCKADIVALQELDVRRARTGRIDQAEGIARALGMQLHFHPAIRVMEELYGDAVLTSWPSRLIKAGPLPGAGLGFGSEPRGALWAAVRIGEVELQVINTHLDVRARERSIQVDALLGPEWIGHEACREPLVLAGDFNAVPRSRAYRRLTARFQDAQVGPTAGGPRPTFPTRMPFLRIDHVFVSRSLKVSRVEVIRTPLARVASDHLPLAVDIGISAAAACH